MLEVHEALKLIAEHTPSPRIAKRPVDGSLVGYVLAEDVRASESVPAFRASIVDGYAVRLSLFNRKFNICGSDELTYFPRFPFLRPANLTKASIQYR
jgi:molybdopterin biosynthesis enzyme